MRLKQAWLSNFGSYKELTFTFDAQGLALIQGPTGSGKSTLFDAAAWILYGITAKDGSVDDVRSWNDLSLPTTGTLILESRGINLTVTRIRGKATENDLYFSKDDSETEHRGTNLKETQTLLNLLLGVDSSAYLAASYYCEYSPSATFFVSNAIQRRALFDRVANLSFPTSLANSLSDKISESKKIILSSESNLVSLNRELNLSMSSLKDSTERSEQWDSKFLHKVEDLQEKSRTFDSTKEAELNHLRHEHSLHEFHRQEEITGLTLSLTNTQRLKSCPTCGNETVIDFTGHIQKEMDKVRNSTNPYTYSIERTLNKTNTFDDELKDHFKQVNPFKAQIQQFESQRKSIALDLEDEQLEHYKLKNKLEEYEHLKDLAGELKEQLLVKSVDYLQHLTNDILAKYFDGELSVNFTIAGSNALDINLFKNGHEAVYKQLSKGQRQLLKLSFSVAVMGAVSNRSGVHFSSLFFDEALDGLDSDLKIKAFSLFSSLEIDHESIFVIDHAEQFKSLFASKYVASISADVSTLVYEQQD